MNLLVVGAGGHAFSAWRPRIQAHPDWTLAGIVDTNTEKLDHADLWGVPEENAFPTISDAVRWGSDPVDAVLITTPIPTHHAIATEAIQHGLHVILEKNMAGTLEQGQALVRLARTHPEVCTVVGTQYRFRPIWWTLRQLFTTGASPVGPLSLVRFRSTASQGAARHGWRASLPDIFAEDMFAHHVDCLRYATGMEVVQISARRLRPSWSGWLGSSGLLAHMALAPAGKERDRASWVPAQYYGDWQCRGVKREWEDLHEFYGELGSLRVEPPETPPDHLWERSAVADLVGEPAGSRLVTYLESGQARDLVVKELPKRTDVEATRPEFPNPEGHVDQMYILEELAQSIRSGGAFQPQTCFEEGFKTFVVTRGAVQSAQEDRAVWLPAYWPDPVLPP